MIPFLVTDQLLAAEHAIAPLQHFDALITAHSGIVQNELTQEIPIEFSIVKKGFQNKGQLGGNHSTWLVPINGPCEGSIDIQAFEKTEQPPMGSEGTFNYFCKNGGLFRGTLKETEIPTEGNFSSIWQATGTKVQLPTQGSGPAPKTIVPQDVKFTLKIRKRK